MDKLIITFGNRSDVGKVRDGNEDYMESFKSTFGDIFIVCDGMGGHVAGEVASRLAVSTIKEFILANPDNTTSTKQILTDAIISANNALTAKAKSSPDLKGMGTTVVVLILRAGVAYYGYVGDSRLYMIRNGNIYQLSRDQSYVQGLVDQGMISYEEAETHPRKNELTQALGINEEVKPAINGIGLKIYRDDRFIVCSDGLSAMVGDRDILDIAGNMPPMDACERLVEIANLAGGIDNITLQIVQVMNGEALPDNLKDLPPDGAIDKTLKPRSNLRDINFESGQGGFQQNGIPVKKKKYSALFAYGSVAVLLITYLLAAFSFKYFPFEEDKSIGRIGKETTTIVDYDKQLDSLINTISEFNKTLFENPLSSNLPTGYICENISYKGYDEIKPSVFEFKDLKDELKSKNITYISTVYKDKTGKSLETPVFEIDVSENSKNLKYDLELIKVPQGYKFVSLKCTTPLPQDNVETTKKEPNRNGRGSDNPEPSPKREKDAQPNPRIDKEEVEPKPPK